MTKKNSLDIPERFWARVDRSGGEDACWPWLGWRKGLYGCATYHYKQIKSHVVALWLHLGRRPAGFVIHSCDNPPCCNPKHLREGTHIENMRDMRARGRSASGPKNSNARLTESQVLEMISDPRINSQVAKDYGVARATVWNIRAGRSWNYLTGIRRVAK